MSERRSRGSDTVDAAARVLAVGTYVSFGFALAGTILMLLAGHVPVTQPGPPFDPARLPAELLAGRSAAFLWIALLVAVVLPSARVITAAIGYLREGDPRQSGVAVAVLCVLLASSVIALATR